MEIKTWKDLKEALECQNLLNDQIQRMIQPLALENSTDEEIAAIKKIAANKANQARLVEVSIHQFFLKSYDEEILKNHYLQ
jgi:hypothetical protein